MWPPTNPPSLLSTKCAGFDTPLALEKKLLAWKKLSMLYAYAAPCVWLDPDLSITFTDAPPASPCSASVALVATLTFSMASMEGTKVVWYGCQGFMALTPSIRTAAPLMPVPLKANSIDFDGLFVPPASCPLGGVAPGTN